MLLHDSNDAPLLAAFGALGLVAMLAWPGGSSFPEAAARARPAHTTAEIASPPADYGAAPLSGTTAMPSPKGGATVDIVRDPSDLPPPVGNRGPRRVNVDLYTVEVTGQLADGATYRYWTFNGKVPGPFVRVRIGDIVTVHLTNDANSTMMHNVDFHAVMGPGGGAKATEAAPGETRGFQFKAMHAGLFVYHCAVPMAAQHIANGMYGMILVEPAGGLPTVDKEFYVMQGEVYTEAKFGAQGLQTQSYDKLMNEMPEYYVFNGAVGAISETKPLHATVGQTVRIFFGDAGPDKTSSFHVIGQVFDRAWQLGSLTSRPLTDVQTVGVPPGAAAIVDMTMRVPGKYMLVDHALTRVERGLSGAIIVDGAANAEIYRPVDLEHSATATSY